MTVQGLIDLLRHHDPGALVVVAKDAEGNEFSPLDCLSKGGYAARAKWSGVVGNLGEGGEPCVVVWPLN
jgi:hypothetical protein